MFKSSSNSLAKVNIATDWAHDDRLSDPFLASLLSGVVVGGFGRSTFADPRTGVTLRILAKFHRNMTRGYERVKLFYYFNSDVKF